ncbi:MAG: Xaa-Pro peptidase family protein, partial [Dehalococcoidales bacterium]|nr:Xaa-Pro peptidase family protein [Dehalococcoidales bacterium]
MTASRITKLRQEMAQREVDAMLISQADNRYYLSGFSGSDGFLVFTAKDAIIATDFRYVEQVKKESPHFTLFQIKGRMTDWLLQLLMDIDVQKLGFEAANVSFGLYKEMTTILDVERPDLQLVPLTGMVEKLRTIKEPDEIAFIQQAADISDKAMDSLTADLKPGMTELELAWQLEKTMREMGSQNMPFEVIVGAGKNGALPHAKPSDYRIKAGEPIVIDMGARYKGYSSDLTRTVIIGEPDALFRKIYGIVLRAQENAIDGIIEGMNGVDADDLARHIIVQEGFADKFGHGLGHGVGLATHDPGPSLSPLAPNT